MKSAIAGITGVAFVVSSLFGASPSHAAPGSLNSPSVSITWDDANWYIPTGCTDFLVPYSVTPANYTGVVKFINQYGDTLGQQHLPYNKSTSSSGTLSVKVCALDRLGIDDKGTDIPITVFLEDVQDKYNGYGDGSRQVVQGTAVLRTRNPQSAPVTAAPNATTVQPTSVRCINKKTFKKKKFVGRAACPKGWVKI